MEKYGTTSVMPAGKVAVVAHDAGGAEILSSWIRRNQPDHVAVLGGPASAIFKRKVPDISTSGMTEAIAQSKWVLSGTGNADLEYQAIAASRKIGRYVVAFLDHWCGYQRRFIRNGKAIFPDEIWVGDEDALGLARQMFPQVKSKRFPNPYWIDEIEKFNNLETFDCENALLFMSPYDHFYLDKRYPLTDDWILRKVIEFFKESTKFPNVTSLTIRIHPSERESKYVNFCYPGVVIRHDHGEDLVASIARNRFVAGQNSMAQVIAKLCGRTSINVISDTYTGEEIPQKYVDHVVRLRTS
jgi:hypothetical protein